MIIDILTISTTSHQQKWQSSQYLLHLGCSRGNVELGDALDFDRVARPAALRFVVRHLLHIRCHDSTCAVLFSLFWGGIEMVLQLQLRVQYREMMEANEL